MHSSILVAALFTIGALASLLAKRPDKIETVVKTVIALNATKEQYPECEFNKVENEYIPLKELNNSVKDPNPGNYEGTCAYHHIFHRATILLLL